MKNTISWVVIALIIIIGGWLFLSSSTTPTEEGPIKIGATLALSGKFAYLGEAELNGLMMAVEEINSKGGINRRQIELIAEDNQGEARQAVSGVSKLLNVDKVDIIFSAFTHITNAIKEIVKQKNKIMLYASTYRNIAESDPLFFRDYFDAIEDARVLADAVKKTKYKKIAFLTEVSDQCLQFEQTFNRNVKNYGVNIVKRESFDTAEKDLRTSLLKIKESSPEAIIVCAWRNEPILMKQLKELDMINIQTFHWVAPFLPTSDTKEMRNLFEENNAISTWYWIAESEYNNLQKEFSKKFQKKYNTKLIGDSVYAYDDIYVLADALKICDNKGQVRNSTCISNQLIKTNREGIAGKLMFTDKGVSNRNISSVERVKNGVWIGY